MRDLADQREVTDAMDEATEKAWRALSQGKYPMFGYWAGVVTHYRRLAGLSGTPSPFGSMRAMARERLTPEKDA